MTIALSENAFAFRLKNVDGFPICFFRHKVCVCGPHTHVVFRIQLSSEEQTRIEVLTCSCSDFKRTDLFFFYRVLRDPAVALIYPDVAPLFSVVPWPIGIIPK